MCPNVNGMTAAAAHEHALVALILLLDGRAAMAAGSLPDPRSCSRIALHLRALAGRDDMPETLRDTCEALCEAWSDRLREQLATPGRE